MTASFTADPDLRLALPTQGIDFEVYAQYPVKPDVFRDDLPVPPVSEVVTGHVIVAHGYGLAGLNLGEGRTSSWVTRFHRAVRRIGRLSSKEHTGDIPTALARMRTHDLIERLWLHSLKPNRVAATADGGIMISFFGDTRRANVECSSDGAMMAAATKSNGDKVHVWTIDSEEDLQDTFEEIAATIKSRSSTSDVSARPPVDSLFPL